MPLFFFNAGKRFHRLNQLEKIAGQTAVAPDAGGLFFPGRAQGLLQCRVKAAGRALPGQHAGTAHHHAQYFFVQRHNGFKIAIAGAGAFLAEGAGRVVAARSAVKTAMALVTIV